MRSLICSALLALVLASPARAGNLLDLSVVDRDSGETLSTYVQNGKLYVPGTPGHRYAVRLSNRTGARVLAVLSVDGVNAVSGETANANQSGYVLDAWESTEINGWRKNLNEVAQFNFTSLPDSYAAQTGRPANVGVIGVAVFTERERRWIAEQRIEQAQPVLRRRLPPENHKPSNRNLMPQWRAASHNASASAPVMAIASGRKSARPSSSVPVTSRPRPWPSGTTAIATWPPAASFHAARLPAASRSHSRAALSPIHPPAIAIVELQAASAGHSGIRDGWRRA